MTTPAERKRHASLVSAFACVCPELVLAKRCRFDIEIAQKGARSAPPVVAEMPLASHLGAEERFFLV
jgi:hypothetical protein